ncbi:hypothetical protein [Marinicellulosiphila megalodicopiae]|uniref:hypothetical protein n=1 Tax=Marinicellulosiphila megalodicopiae TaxID=2724896 RepID=UPI003BB1CB3E
MKLFIKPLISIFLVGFSLNALSAVIWSDWLDRDNQSGNGDYELKQYFSQSAIGCSNPIDIQAREVESKTSSDILLKPLIMSPNYGLACINSWTPNTQCLDWEIRFACEFWDLDEQHLIGEWQKDLWGEVSEAGLYVPLSHSLQPARYREAFKLYANGTAEFKVLASNDAHYFSDGQWNLKGDMLEISYWIKYRNVTSYHLYRVVSKQGSALELEFITQYY